MVTLYIIVTGKISFDVLHKSEHNLTVKKKKALQLKFSKVQQAYSFRESTFFGKSFEMDENWPKNKYVKAFMDTCSAMSR